MDARIRETLTELEKLSPTETMDAIDRESGEPPIPEMARLSTTPGTYMVPMWTAILMRIRLKDAFPYRQLGLAGDEYMQEWLKRWCEEHPASTEVTPG